MKYTHDHKPWTEEQWATYLRRSEFRAARFEELLETLRDAPDRDEQLMREMGVAHAEWDEIQDSVDLDDAGGLGEALAPASDDTDDSAASELLDESLRAIPAYALTLQAAEDIEDILADLVEDGGLDENEADLIESTLEHVQQIAARIATGHAMGYDDDVLCANIVCNLAAKRFCKRSIESLQALRDSNVLSADEAGAAIVEIAVVESAIDERIDELRSRVWW